jgi:hypothetical protein
MAHLYILDEQGEPQPVTDVEVWGLWFEKASRLGLRTVASDRDEGDPEKEVWVSTVFLGADHNFLGRGRPILWETLVFGGPLDGETDRYSSREAALAGHQAMCQRVKEAK